MFLELIYFRRRVDMDLSKLSDYELSILPELIEKEVKSRKYGTSLIFYYRQDDTVFWFKNPEECLKVFKEEAECEMFDIYDFPTEIGKYKISNDKYNKLENSGICLNRFDFQYD